MERPLTAAGGFSSRDINWTKQIIVAKTDRSHLPNRQNERISSIHIFRQLSCISSPDCPEWGTRSTCNIADILHKFGIRFWRRCGSQVGNVTFARSTNRSDPLIRFFSRLSRAFSPDLPWRGPPNSYYKNISSRHLLGRSFGTTWCFLWLDVLAGNIKGALYKSNPW